MNNEQNTQRPSNENNNQNKKHGYKNKNKKFYHHNHHNRNQEGGTSGAKANDADVKAKNSTEELIENEKDNLLKNNEETEYSITVDLSEDTDIPSTEVPKLDESLPKVEVIGIRFRTAGKVYFFDPCGKKLKSGSHAIVETSRGLEYGHVAFGNMFVNEKDIVPPLRPVVRIATDADAARFEENSKKEQEAFKICLGKIEAHKLDMKLVDVEYTFDNSKLLFYFTSSGRVDFRELVKDLASVFRTRIELRQIGIRDEAKLMGGLGVCGRPLCCNSFLADFVQVSIKMAKEQNLSLNSNKISGACGRLMCCLRYEQEAYEEEIRLCPPVDAIVRTEDGTGTVIELNPIAGLVKVKLDDKDTQPKFYHRDTLKVIKMPKVTNEEKGDEEPDSN